MTLNEIISLLTIQVTGLPSKHVPGNLGATADLSRMNMIERDFGRDQERGDPDRWKVTEKGRCFCEFLQTLDLPKQSWSMTE